MKTLFLKLFPGSCGFRKEYISQNLWFQRIFIITAIGFYIGLGYVHSINNPYISQYVFIIRLGIVAPMAIFVFVLTFFDNYEKYGGFFFACCIIAAGTGMIFLIKVSHSPVKHYLISGLVVLIFINYTLKLISPWPFISGWSLVLVYNIMDRICPLMDVPFFLKSNINEFLYINIYLLLSNLFGSYVTYIFETYEKKNYLLKTALEQEKERIVTANQTLESKAFERARVLDEKNKELVYAFEKERGMEDELAKGKEEYLRIIENIYEACFEIDVKGRFKVFNSAVKKLLAFKEENLRACYIWDFLDQENSEKLKNELWEFNKSNKKSAALRFNILNPDSTKKDVEVTISRRMGKKGELAGFLGIARDITRRIEKEKAVHKAKENAEKSDKIKSRFIENINHEIRTPLNGISGFTHILLGSRDLTDEDRKKAELIKLSLDQMNFIVGDLLDFSRIHDGYIIFEKESFSFKTMIEELKLRMERYDFYKKTNFVFNSDENIDNFYIGDKQRLIKIFENILEYAVKSSFGEKIVFFVEPVEKIHSGDLLVFSVLFSGNISAERIKERFYTDREGRSFYEDDEIIFSELGVGFSLAKYYLEKMGGRVFFESNESSDELNTKIVMELFMEKDMGVISKNDLKKQANILENSVILVVEDNIVNQKVIMSMLKKDGAKVLVASNGQEGIDILEKEDIDLVLMDIQMPVMDGITATQRIRAGDSGMLKKDIPVIAVTAHTVKVDKNKCLDAGMNAYITKPVKPDILIFEVTKFLLEKRQKK